jgi:hypothetical protein
LYGARESPQERGVSVGRPFRVCFQQILKKVLVQVLLFRQSLAEKFGQFDWRIGNRSALPATGFRVYGLPASFGQITLARKKGDYSE